MDRLKHYLREVKRRLPLGQQNDSISELTENIMAQMEDKGAERGHPLTEIKLLNRYLQEVKRGLPTGQQDDIIRELAENIMAQMEDKEADLGRSLTEAEQEAILQRHGSPMVVASRYVVNPRTLAFGRQLIGPVLFPFYTRVLAFTLGIALVVCVALVLPLHSSGGSIRLLEALQASFFQLSIQFGIVTGVFILAERQVAAFPNSWNPRAVRPVTKATPQVSRLESFSQIVALAVFLLWLLSVRNAPDLIFGSAPDVLQLGPIWGQLYLPMVLLTLVGLAQASINLVRPDWVRLRQAARVLSSGVWLLMMGFLLQAGNWVVLANPGGELASDQRPGVEMINHYIFYNLLVLAIISALIALYEVWRLVRRSSPRVPSRA